MVPDEEREEEIEEAQLQVRLTIATLDDREEVLGYAEPHLRARLTEASKALTETLNRQPTEPHSGVDWDAAWFGPRLGYLAQALSVSEGIFSRGNMRFLEEFNRHAHALPGEYWTLEQNDDVCGGAPMFILDIGSKQLARDLVEYCVTSNLPVLSLSLGDLDASARALVASQLGELLLEPAGAGCGIVITASSGDASARHLATAFLKQARRAFVDKGVIAFTDSSSPDQAGYKNFRNSYKSFVDHSHQFETERYHDNYALPFDYLKMSNDHDFPDRNTDYIASLSRSFGKKFGSFNNSSPDWKMRKLRLAACNAAIVRRAADLATLSPGLAGATIIGRVEPGTIGEAMARKMFPEPVLYIEGGTDHAEFVVDEPRIRVLGSKTIVGPRLIDGMATGGLGFLQGMSRY